MTLSFFVAIVITCEKREKNGKNYTKRKNEYKKFIKIQKTIAKTGGMCHNIRVRKKLTVSNKTSQREYDM